MSNEQLETKVCNDCGRSFMSEIDDALTCYVCNGEEEPQSFHDMAIEDEEVKQYIDKQYEIREEWMMGMIRKNLSWYDRFLFFFYKKLADRFSGGDRVVVLQQRDGYNDTRFGIRIYGKMYWYNEKDTLDYDSVSER